MSSMLMFSKTAFSIIICYRSIDIFHLSTFVQLRLFSSLRYLHVLLVLLYIGNCVPPSVLASDVFCGKLSVYKQQWFNTRSTAISSQKTDDLKQCLELCCNIPNCDAVTFMGVLENRRGEANCMLVNCNGECGIREKTVTTDGVVSVIISRRDAQKTTERTFTANDSRQESRFNERFRAAEMTPIWVIGLIIVVAVLCIGLNVGLISAYICWRRQRALKQKAHISTINTLHAFNPT